MKRFLIFLLIAAGLLIPHVAGAVNFTTFSDINTDGSSSGTLANGISSDGNTIVGRGSIHVENSVSPLALKWDASGTPTSLGYLEGSQTPYSMAYAVSADGSVIAGQSYSSSSIITREAFKWTEADGMTGLGTLGGYQSKALAVSADGTSIVGWSVNTAGRTEAFIWTEENGMVGLGDLPGGSTKSEATDVSGDGSIVVGYSRGETYSYEAFIWTDIAGMTGLGTLGGNRSYANGISEDGTTVVGKARNLEGDYEAFIWTEESGMIGLGDLVAENISSSAIAVSADGSVVLGESGSTDDIFIWTEEEGMVSILNLLAGEGIDLSEWSNLTAADLTSDGKTIVGYGQNPEGVWTGWKISLDAAPVPAPSALCLLGIGLISLLGFQRKNCSFN